MERKSASIFSNCPWETGSKSVLQPFGQQANQHTRQSIGPYNKATGNPKPTRSNAVTVYEETRDGQPKAYIPNFFYRAPFGYPRYKDLNYYRQLAASIYVDMCVTAIIDEVCSIQYEIVAEDRAGNEVPGKDADVERVQDFFENPNTNKESWEMIVRMMLPDLLELNSGVMVKIFNMFGEMVEICARDGMAFTKNPDPYGFYTTRADLILMKNILGEGEEQTQTMEYPAIQAEMTAEDAHEEGAYFQYGFNTGARPIPFGRREVVWFEKKVRTDNLYGRSSMEVLAKTVQTLIYAVESQLEYFNDNSIPPGVLGLEGMSSEDLTAFGQQWIQQQKVQDDLGNWKRANHKLPMVNKMPKFERLGFTNQELELIESQKWWSKLVWGAFGITATELGFCYSDDTQVLTDNGLKYYWEIKEDDKIATIINQKEIEYIKPDKIHTFDVKDRNFHFYKNNCVDVLVSDNHRMYYRTPKKEEYKCSPSNEIDVDTVKFLQGGLGWEGEYLDEINIPLVEYENNKDKGRYQQTTFNIDEWCEFLGYYLSEGSVLKKMRERKQFHVKIAQVKPEGIKIMKPLAEKMGFRREKVCWTLNNKSLALYLSRFGGSLEKHIPQEIKNLPKPQLRILLDALVSGDGSRREGEDSFNYSSSSKRLIEDVFEICLKLGYKASIYEREFDNPKWNKTYELNVNISQKEPRVVISTQRFNEKYTGTMWCPSVRNRPFITCRNGKVGIHYNTEDAKGSANQIVQTSVAKKRIIYPLLRLIEYHVNTEIIPEFGVEGVRYKYKIFDIDEETKKWGLYKLQTESDLKTINEVRNAEGLDDVEWGDKNVGERSPNQGTNINVGDPRQQDADKINRDSANNRDKMTGKPAKGDKPKDVKKASTSDSPNTLGPGEELSPSEKKLKKNITDLLKVNKKKVFELLEEQGKPEQLLQIKGIDDLPRIIKKIFEIFTFRKVVDEVIKVNFQFGWDTSEKQIDKNIPMNNNAVQFLQDHTFDNVKGMTEEIANNLKAELGRGIINGEGVTKLKARVTKVFNVGDNRAEIIAITEVGRAENQGKLLAMKGSGLDMKKQWLSAHDDRTSDICKHLDGQIVGLDEDFHYKDWSGQSPPSHPRCRSVLLFLEKEEDSISSE